MQLDFRARSELDRCQIIECDRRRPKCLQMSEMIRQDTVIICETCKAPGSDLIPCDGPECSARLHDQESCIQEVEGACLACLSLHTPFSENKLCERCARDMLDELGDAEEAGRVAAIKVKAALPSVPAPAAPTPDAKVPAATGPFSAHIMQGLCCCSR